MARTPAPRRVMDPAPLPNACPEGDCQRQQAEALTRIADALESLAPAAHTVHELADRLERLCVFIRRWLPRLWWLLPIILTFTNSISPELAEAIGQMAIRAAGDVAANGAVK